MRDLKYIIKRIIIGVGIVLVLSCLNGCKVKAYSFTQNHRTVKKDTVLSNNNNILLNSFRGLSFYRNIKNNSIYSCSDSNSSCQEIFFDNDFTYKNIGLILYNYPTPVNSQRNRSCAYLSKNDLPILSNNTSYDGWNNAKYLSDTYVFCTSLYNNMLRTSANAFVSENEITESFMISTYFPDNNYTNISSNINWNWSNEHYVDNDNIINIGGIPDFVSFHAIPNLYQNVITSYNIKPEFSVFDNDTYKYQYSFDSKRWLGLNENNQLLKINNNTTIYVRILKRENNEYINGATLTISQIGTFFYDDLDYNVKISGEYRTRNYLNDNLSSKSQSKIKEYQIYTDFYPNSSILKYQYQWVPNNSEFSEDKWVDIPKLETNNNQFGDFTYVVSENGVFYARILDKDNNYLASATLTVDSIGKLALDSNDRGIDNFFTRLSKKIGYGGPISTLFRIPIDILNKIYSYSSASCSPYKITTLLGTDFVLPCYNFRETFGNTYYTLFDSLLCFVLSLFLFKFVRNIYDKFINMEDISS